MDSTSNLFLLQRQQGKAITSKARVPIKKITPAPTAPKTTSYNREFLIYKQTGKARKQASDIAFAAQQEEYNKLLTQQEQADAEYLKQKQKYDEDYAAYQAEQAKAQADYESQLADYNAQTKAQAEAEAKYEADLLNYNTQKEQADAANKAAEDKYNADLLAYQTEEASYETQLAEYNKQKKEYDDAKAAYDAQQAAYDTAQADYNKEVEADRLAFKLYNKAVYEGRNPYLSDQDPLVRKYYKYYQDKDEAKRVNELLSKASIVDTNKIDLDKYKAAYDTLSTEEQQFASLGTPSTLQYNINKGYSALQLSDKYTFTDALGQPMSIDPTQIGYQGMTTQEGVIFLKPKEPTKSTTIFDLVSPNKPLLLDTIFTPPKTTTITPIEPFALTAPKMNILEPTYKAPTAPTYSILKPVTETPKKPESSYIDVLGQGVSYDPIKASLGTIQAYAPTNPTKFYQQELGLKMQAMAIQAQKNKPIISPLITPQPTAPKNPTYKELTSGGRYIGGTLDWLGFQAQGLVSKQPVAFEDYKPYQMRGTFVDMTPQEKESISLFKTENTKTAISTVARNAPFFVPIAGQALLIGEGIESYATPGGRKKISEQTTSLIGKGWNPQTASFVSSAAPPVQVALGALGLRAETKAIAANMELKALEKTNPELSIGLVKGNEGKENLLIVSKKNAKTLFSDVTQKSVVSYEVTPIEEQSFQVGKGKGYTQIESTNLLGNTNTKGLGFTFYGEGSETTARVVKPTEQFTLTKPLTGSTPVKADIFITTSVRKQAGKVIEDIQGSRANIGGLVRKEGENFLVIGGELQGRLYPTGNKYFVDMTKESVNAEPIGNKLGKFDVKSFGVIKQLETKSNVGDIISSGKRTSNVQTSQFGDIGAVVSYGVEQKTTKLALEPGMKTNPITKAAPLTKTITFIQPMKELRQSINQQETMSDLNSMVTGPELFKSSETKPIASTIKLAPVKVNKITSTKPGFEASAPAMKTELLSLPVQRSVQKPMEITKQSYKQLEQPAMKQIQKPMMGNLMKQKPAEIMKLKQEPIQKYKMKQETGLLYKLKNIITTTSAYKTPTVKTPNIKLTLPKTSENKLSNIDLLTSAYKSYVLRKGKKQYLSGVAARAEAIKRGETFATRTLAATFGIEKTNALLKKTPSYNYQP